MKKMDFKFHVQNMCKKISQKVVCYVEYQPC